MNRATHSSQVAPHVLGCRIKATNVSLWGRLGGRTQPPLGARLTGGYGCWTSRPPSHAPPDLTALLAWLLLRGVMKRGHEKLA